MSLACVKNKRSFTLSSLGNKTLGNPEYPPRPPSPYMPRARKGQSGQPRPLTTVTGY
jgi:hypothetical protein